MKIPAALALLISLAAAQQVGTEQTETHPKMSWSTCTGQGSCTSKNAEVVIDANWRWLHNTDGYDNCYDGNEWVESICSTATECAEMCAVEGADYGTTYGASTSGDALTLKFVTEHEYGKNIGSRFYLMESEDKYQMFDLLGNEFTFDVDLSTLDCGLNGALYFVAMEADGGMASYPSNAAGAKYGTGYCDAQCARDLKFVGGKVRPVPSSTVATYKQLTFCPRPMSRDGSHLRTTPTPVSAHTAPAVPKSMSGVLSSLAARNTHSAD